MLFTPNTLFCSTGIWTKWRTNSICLNLSGVCFDGNIDLAAVNLSNANLENCRFLETDLNCAFLQNANLRNAFLQKVDLEDADLTNADLTGADLKQAILNRAKLTNANLTKASLQEAETKRLKLIGANLTEANVRWVDFMQLDLTGVNLTGADLTGSDLSGAILKDINLIGAIGIGTRKDEIEFAKHILERIKNGENRKFMGPLSNHTDFTIGHMMPEWICAHANYAPEYCEDIHARTSRWCPTIGQYFFTNDIDTLPALKAIAAGELSVFSK